MRNLLFIAVVFVFLIVSCGGEESNDEPVCEEGATMTGKTKCGLNNRGRLVQECEDNQWVDTDKCEDDDVCKDYETNEGSCGLNGRGTITETCVKGSWTTSKCYDRDVCVDGNTITCGCGGRYEEVYYSARTVECINGQKVEGECEMIGYEKVSNSTVTLECKNGICFINGNEYEDIEQCWNVSDGSGNLSYGVCGCDNLELHCGSTVSYEGC